MKLIAATLLAFTLLIGGTAHADSEHSRRDCPNPYAVAEHFGTVRGEPGYVPRFDLNDDGAVTVGDIILASNCWLMDDE